MLTARPASPETANETLACHPSASAWAWERVISVVTTRVTPTTTTVSQNQRNILRNKLRIGPASSGLIGQGIQVAHAANAFDALCSVAVCAHLLSQITDMRVDAAVEWRELSS